MANDPVNLARSRGECAIAPGDHLLWLRSQIELYGQHFWVGEVDGLALGYVRFSPFSGAWELRFRFDPLTRGREWSTQLLREGIRRMVEGDTAPILAVVHINDQEEQGLLLELGFFRVDAARAAIMNLSVNRDEVAFAYRLAISS